jgi:peptidoglycan-associated lipoprotein
MLKKSMKALMLGVIVLSFAACSSKKKTEDSGLQSGNTAIESSPMSFDAQGSDSGKISGLSTINFEYDKSLLSKEAKEKLAGNAAWMKTNTSASIQIEGHCDARGSIEYNLALGERRAKAVKDYMVGLGIPTGRLSIISYGKEKPLAQGDSEADYAKNRRANFLPLNQ